MRKWFNGSSGAEVSVERKTWVPPTRRVVERPIKKVTWYIHMVRIVRLILVTVIIHFSLSNSLLAKPRTIYMNLQKSAESVAGVYQYCGKIAGERLEKKFQIDDFERTDQSLGVVSPFKVTSHIYAPEFSKGRKVGLTIAYAGPLEKRNCAVLIMLAPGISNFNIKTSFRDSKGLQNLTAKQLVLVKSVEKWCSELGDSERRSYFPYGNYVFDQTGGVLEDPAGFYCDSAAYNNTSAVDLEVGSVKFRVTVLYSTVFLEEI